jgi:hypothetical protein
MEGIWTNYPIYDLTLQLAWATVATAPPPSPPPAPVPAPTPPPTLPANVSGLFSGESGPGGYLKDYPAGAVTTSFPSLDAAMRACAGPLADCCGGVTRQNGGYEVR